MKTTDLLNVNKYLANKITPMNSHRQYRKQRKSILVELTTNQLRNKNSADINLEKKYVSEYNEKWKHLSTKNQEVNNRYFVENNFFRYSQIISPKDSENIIPQLKSLLLKLESPEKKSKTEGRAICSSSKKRDRIKIQDLMKSQEKKNPEEFEFRSKNITEVLPNNNLSNRSASERIQKNAGKNISLRMKQDRYEELKEVEIIKIIKKNTQNKNVKLSNNLRLAIMNKKQISKHLRLVN